MDVVSNFICQCIYYFQLLGVITNVNKKMEGMDFIFNFDQTCHIYLQGFYFLICHTSSMHD
jgi:hypothetical protein